MDSSTGQSCFEDVPHKISVKSSDSEDTLECHIRQSCDIHEVNDRFHPPMPKPDIVRNLTVDVNREPMPRWTTMSYFTSPVDESFGAFMRRRLRERDSTEKPKNDHQRSNWNPFSRFRFFYCGSMSDAVAASSSSRSPN